MRDPQPRGNLYAYDYAKNEFSKELKLIEFPEGADFHPMGINFYRDSVSPDSPTVLFVVNHERTGSNVVVFGIDLEKHEAKYLRRVSDAEAIRSPNGICPVSYTSFYVTNDHYYPKRKSTFRHLRETKLALEFSFVTFVDFTGREPVCRIVAKDLAFANGIAMTPTGTEVIVACTSRQELRIYQRNPLTDDLSKNFELLPVPFIRPDNLSFDYSLKTDDETAFNEEGKFCRGLIVAGHPSSSRYRRMSHKPHKRKAPSWVAELRRGKGKDTAPFPTSIGLAKSFFHLQTLYQSE